MIIFVFLPLDDLSEWMWMKIMLKHACRHLFTTDFRSLITFWYGIDRWNEFTSNESHRTRSSHRTIKNFKWIQLTKKTMTFSREKKKNCNVILNPEQTKMPPIDKNYENKIINQSADEKTWKMVNLSDVVLIELCNWFRIFRIFLNVQNRQNVDFTSNLNPANNHTHPNRKNWK